MPEIRQGTRMGWGIYQLFTAADGEEIFIGITSNAHWERFCTEFGLAASRGSDFHSPEESHTDLGKLPDLPGSVTPVWELLQSRIH